MQSSSNNNPNSPDAEGDQPSGEELSLSPTNYKGSDEVEANSTGTSKRRSLLRSIVVGPVSKRAKTVSKSDHQQDTSDDGVTLFKVGQSGQYEIFKIQGPHDDVKQGTRYRKTRGLELGIGLRPCEWMPSDLALAFPGFSRYYHVHAVKRDSLAHQAGVCANDVICWPKGPEPGIVQESVGYHTVSWELISGTELKDRVNNSLLGKSQLQFYVARRVSTIASAAPLAVTDDALTAIPAEFDAAEARNQLQGKSNENVKVQPSAKAQSADMNKNTSAPNNQVDWSCRVSPYERSSPTAEEGESLFADLATFQLELQRYTIYDEVKQNEIRAKLDRLKMCASALNLREPEFRVGKTSLYSVFQLFQGSGDLWGESVSGFPKSLLLLCLSPAQIARTTYSFRRAKFVYRLDVFCSAAQREHRLESGIKSYAMLKKTYHIKVMFFLTRVYLAMALFRYASFDDIKGGGNSLKKKCAVCLGMLEADAQTDLPTYISDNEGSPYKQFCPSAEEGESLFEDLGLFLREVRTHATRLAQNQEGIRAKIERLTVFEHLTAFPLQQKVKCAFQTFCQVCELVQGRSDMSGDKRFDEYSEYSAHMLILCLSPAQIASSRALVLTRASYRFGLVHFCRFSQKMQELAKGLKSKRLKSFEGLKRNVHIKMMFFLVRTHLAMTLFGYESFEDIRGGGESLRQKVTDCFSRLEDDMLSYASNKPKSRTIHATAPTPDDSLSAIKQEETTRLPSSTARKYS